MQKGPVKILYIANRPDIFSGGEISLLELVSRVDRARFEPVLLCPGEGEFADKVRAMGITVETCELPSMKTMGLPRILRASGEVRRIIREHAVDIVHTNGMRAQFYASLAVRGTGSVLLWHLRESARDMFLYEKYLAARADVIVCVSEGVKRAHFGRSPRISGKIKVIYNGVDTRAFYPDQQGRERLRLELGVSPSEKLIGITGLFVPLKGHRALLNAFKRLSAAYPDARLLMIGKAVDREYFQLLKENSKKFGLGKKVIFAEPRPDMRAVLSALDIFVLPSEREGFSRALLEAMACALPIVASDVSGNNEAVKEGETGLLVPFGDEILLKEAFTKLLADPQKCREMGERSRERVKELFSIEAHVHVFEALYSGIGRAE